jgi:hypothetical protein
MNEENCQSGTIQTFDKSGTQCSFEFRCEVDDTLGSTDNALCHTTPRLQTVTYLVTDGQGVFEFTLIDETVRMRVDSMAHHEYEPFKGKGITQAFIRLAFEKHGKDVVSSSNKESEKKHPVTNLPLHQYRTIAAQKAWEILQKKGEARYDDAEDRFYYVPSR